MRHPLPFPTDKPTAYHALQDEPPFSAARHLALEPPQQTTSLAQLGYTESEIALCPSSLAITSAFRIFSPEGLATVQHLAARMKSNRNAAAGTGANRLGAYIRGAGYRSRFMRDFCTAPDLLAFLSDLAQTPLAQHTVPAVACAINYAPEDITRAVDNWHVDSVPYDMVILLTPPSEFTGGEFQYFHGTRAEGEALTGGNGEAGTTLDLPPDRVRTMDFGAAGCGFLQQGTRIFHRACRLRAPADRVTLVPAFVPLASPAHIEGTNIANMSRWQDPGIQCELARHAAWLARDELRRLIDDLPLTAPPPHIAARLEKATQSVSDYARLLRDL